MALPEIALYKFYLQNFKEVHRFTVYTKPIGAPRMIRSDAWKQRDCVIEYREFKEKLREVCGPLLIDVQHVWCRAYLPMPTKSWSNKKLVEMEDEPNRQRPDADNLIKSLLDSIFENDSGIWGITCFKLWCKEGEERLEIGLFA